MDSGQSEWIPVDTEEEGLRDLNGTVGSQQESQWSYPPLFIPSSLHSFQFSISTSQRDPRSRSSSSNGVLNMSKCNDMSGPGNTRGSDHFSWELWQVYALIECKKNEWEEFESTSGREHIVSSEVKWRRVQEAVRERGILADTSQLKNKWENILGSYKKVQDHNKHSGNQPYSSLSRVDRRLVKLPVDFSNDHLGLLSSFYDQRAVMNPSRMTKSTFPISNSSIPSSPTEPTGLGEQTDHPSSTTYSKTTNRFNLGVKRKKKSQGQVAEVMEHFTQVFESAERKRECREERHQTWLETSEAKRLELDTNRLSLKQTRFTDESKQQDKLCEAIILMAQAFVQLSQK